MADLNALSLPDLFAELTRAGLLPPLLALAREEDLAATGDITSASIIEPDRQAEASLVPREPGIAAGLATVAAVSEAFHANVNYTPRRQDGQTFRPGQTLGVLQGPLPHILGLERTLLNLVARLCGIATLTRRYVDAVAGTAAAICETRKTTPGLRHLEKYAVRCGGGTLHRLGLHDAVLYKDNHLAHLTTDALPGALTEAIGRARSAHDPTFVEVEVDDLRQLAAVLSMDRGLVDFVLLDNMAPEQLREAVVLRDRVAPEILLEASGGVNLQTVRAVAETGVDRISVGALTHGARSLDVGLDVV